MCPSVDIGCSGKAHCVLYPPKTLQQTLHFIQPWLAYRYFNWPAFTFVIVKFRQHLNSRFTNIFTFACARERPGSFHDPFIMSLAECLQPQCLSRKKHQLLSHRRKWGGESNMSKYFQSWCGMPLARMFTLSLAVFILNASWFNHSKSHFLLLRSSTNKPAHENIYLLYSASENGHAYLAMLITNCKLAAVMLCSVFADLYRQLECLISTDKCRLTSPSVFDSFLCLSKCCFSIKDIQQQICSSGNAMLYHPFRSRHTSVPTAVEHLCYCSYSGKWRFAIKNPNM